MRPASSWRRRCGGREPAGPVARYARGDDYHDVMVDRLRELQRWLSGELGRDSHCASRA